MMKWHYFVHLTAWTVPVVALQWAIGWRIFRRNLRAVVLPAVAGAVFFSLIDQVAVRGGLWFFDPHKSSVGTSDGSRSRKCCFFS